MELVTTFITPVVECLMGVVKRHLSFCFYSTNNVRDMRARIEQLNHKAHNLGTRKERNDANNLVVPHEVPSWLEQVEKICEEARNVPTGGIGCFNMKTRYKAGKKSSGILLKIDNLETQESNIKWSDEQRPLGRVRSTLPSTSEPVVVAADEDDDGTQTGLKSRVLIFKEAMKSLDLNNKIQKIALCGMGGVGKTTMMDQLKKVAEDKKMFDWIVKVVIGKSTNLIAIQQTVAEYIGEPLTETQKDTRAERLRKRFVGMSEDGKKNILVILDDLWEEVDLKDIGLTSPLPNGFKLLLTSRDERVCSQLGVETSRIFRIAVLEDPEAKKLFWEIVGTVSDGNINHDLRKIGEDIVNRCDGLPIAIKTIASTLRDNSVKDVWVDALERLQNKELSFVETVFKTSYENIKDDDEKATFLLSGLFPDDYNIPIEDLMRYGWGLKLFKNSKTISTARRRMNTCVNNLVRSNMLIESDRKGCVKMHDLVRDFVLSNFSNVKQASLVNSDDISEQLTEESYERILLKCKGMCEFPADLNHPNLALLKLLDGDNLDTFREDFYDRMEKLEVVAYDRIRQPLLPRYLTSLRTLCLRSCKSVGDISFIGDLVNLEVLSFAFCGISKLPSAIGNLKKLKLLDLTECVDLCIDDGVFHKLEKLRELYMSAHKGKPIRFTEDSCEGLKMLSSKLIALDVEFFESIIQPKNLSFEKLERFRISMGCQFENYDNDVYAYENTLKLVVSCKELLECKINELFEKTEKLDLSVNEMSSLEQISTYPSQHSFCNLRVLEFDECADLTSIFTVNVASSLTKLESLRVSWCPVLESLVQEGENSEAKVIKFHKLKFLGLYGLPMFVSLCDTDQVMELPQLVELNVTDLPNVTSIFSENNEISATRQPLLNKKIVIPNLKTLEIFLMDKLKEIFSCENNSINVASILTTLESLTVLECPVLESLVQEGENSEAKVIKFHKLKRLELKRLPMFVSLCDTDQVMELPQLVRLTLADLPNVTSIFSESNEICGTRRSLFSKKIVIPNLEELEIRSMEKLKEIWSCENTTSITHVELHNFFNLREIDVFDCPSLVNIFACNWMRLVSHLGVINGQKQQPLSLFHKLTIIWLVNCKSIKYLFSPLLATHLSNLKNISIIDCDGMEEVVSNRDDNEDEHMTAPTTTTLFPHLDQLILRSLPSLKHVGGGVSKGTNNDINDRLKYSQVPVACWSLCQYSREIIVANCPAMLNVVPSHVTGQILMVERLYIHDCIVMKEVFATTDINSSGGLSSNFEESSGGGTDTAHAIPRLTSITAHKLSNLKTMDILNCNSLEHIFTFSTLESLTKLEEISIRKCKAMKVIVREENEEQTMASMAVVFPRLKSIRLEGFFLGMSEFKWPLLNKKIVIPNLENLEIKWMEKLKEIWWCENTTTISDVELHNFSNLRQIHVKYCDSLVNIFACNPMRLVSHLAVINGQKQQPLSLFHNLTDISLGYCKSIKYLFSPLLATHLSNLKNISIIDCDGMEEVVSNRDDNEDEHMTAPTTTTLFPHLDQLILRSLPSLKHVGGGVSKGTNNDINDRLKYSQEPVVCWSLCQYSRHITVFDCPAISQLIPSHVAGQFLTVERLTIQDCIVMKEVFATTDINSSGGLSSNFEETSGGTDTAHAIPRLTSITAHKLSNLKTMDIRNCNSLEHIFTFSTLESLTKLEKILISRCKAMKVIVREENGEQTVASKVIVFPHLKSIGLNFLPNLEGFFLGMSEFKWPLLDDVKIMRCPKMMAFTSNKSTAPKLKYIHSRFSNYSPEWHNFYVKTNSPQTPSPSVENGPLSLHDTIEVNVEDNNFIKEIFASNELLQLPNLEKIQVKRCEWVETVFEVESEVTDSELNSKSQTVVRFPKLREVDLEDLKRLQYIWKSNIQGMKLEFPNLTRLSIHSCFDLKYVVTSSMVGSLMQLQDLHITHCYYMEVILKEEEDEENTEEECNGDAKVSEIIVFPCLKSLTLEDLVLHFQGFYLGKDLDFSLPSLDTLVIKRCPKLEFFTKGRVAAPLLKVIETNLGLSDVGEQDINSFIITKKQEEELHSRIYDVY